MSRRRSHARTTMFSSLALTLALGACKSGDEATAADGEGSAPAEQAKAAEGGAGAPDANTPTAPPVEEDEADDPRAAALAIVKSDAAASVSAKGVKTLGFNLQKISHLFALKATPKAPDWGASGAGEAKLAHDDDIDTAWTCDFGQDKPCALGLALPEKAKVEVLRLYTGGGLRYRDYKGHPRVAKVRIHTDAGFVEAELADSANHAYVTFKEPVETQSLAIEVLSLHEGKNDAQIQFAEIEVYGTDGVPRPPIRLDPAQAWTAWETTVWGDGPDHTIRQVFVYFLRQGGATTEDGGPARRRFARATAVFGEVGDDYALFERLRGTSCEETEGGYMLFDKRNRMYYALNDLGGAGAQVYRHAEGRGFAVGWQNDAGQFTIKGIVEEAGQLQWKRPPRDGTDDAAGQLASWGFETKPLDRGVGLGGAVPGCHRAAMGELEPVLSSAKGEVDSDPSQWKVCSVGANTLYASAPCDMPARAYLVDASGKVLAKHEGKDGDARGMRLRRSGDALFVELSAKQGDTATLYLAEGSALTQIEKNGGLFVRPPSSCQPCTDRWLNPEGGGDDGDDMDEGDAADEAADEDMGEGDAADEDMDGDEGDAADEAPEQPEAPPSPVPPGPM